MIKKTHKKSKTSKKSKISKTSKAPTIYYTHDNGGRPFKVHITGNTVLIHKIQEDESNNDKPKYTDKPILIYQVENYFIGNSHKCKMTLYSGGYGPKFDGNSILLHMNDNNYIYIGEKIYSFKSNAKIVKYISPVGNSDVPYPYAIDSNNSVYLMIEYVILGEYNSSKYDDPYEQYYSENRLTKYKGIQEFKLCNEFWNARYEPFPIPEYNRLISLDWGTNGKKDKQKCNMYAKINNKMILLSKDTYVKLINAFGKHRKYSPLKNKIIVERL